MYAMVVAGFTEPACRPHHSADRALRAPRARRAEFIPDAGAQEPPLRAGGLVAGFLIALAVLVGNLLIVVGVWAGWVS